MKITKIRVRRKAYRKIKILLDKGIAHIWLKCKKCKAISIHPKEFLYMVLEYTKNKYYCPQCHSNNKIDKRSFRKLTLDKLEKYSLLEDIKYNLRRKK